MDLLTGINKVLVRTGTVKSTNQLTSLTDSANQMFIDTAKDNWNEVIDELYSLSSQPRPKSIKSSTITLAAGVREYSLHSKLVMLRFDYHLIDETNNHTITLIEDFHSNLVFGDIEQDDTGLPHMATLNPENGRLLFDRSPTAADAGKIYKYRYEKDLELIDATDEMPFSDTVARALVPAVAERWKFEHQKTGSQEIFDKSMAQAARRLRKAPARSSWLPRQGGRNQMDPFDAAIIQ